jgi:signal transduction histidine kinase
MDTMHPWAWQRLSAGEIVKFEKLDEVPSLAVLDKANWLKRSTKSLLLVPISVGGTELFVFAAVMVARERKFSEEFAQRFRVLGETFANAIFRAAVDRDLHQNEAMLRELNVELSRTEDRERRRLAAVLHDDLAQSIFGATAQLVALRGLPASAPQAQPIDSVISILDQALRQARELTYELCPPVLYERGLVAALSKLGEQLTQRHGLICRVETFNGEHRLNDELAGLMYQAVRELLMNVVKHAHASRADVRLHQSDDQLSITVSDDGIGVVSNGVRNLPSGFGLFNIRHRLAALGGQMEIMSRPGAGCAVRLVFPPIPRSAGSKE